MAEPHALSHEVFAYMCVYIYIYILIIKESKVKRGEREANV